MEGRRTDGGRDGGRERMALFGNLLQIGSMMPPKKRIVLHVTLLLLFGRSRIIVGHHCLTDELFPAAAIFCSPYAL